MAIHSARLAKRLIPESIRVDERCYKLNQVVAILAVADEETKERLFHIKDLLADGGKQEVLDTVNSLCAKRDQR